jgi:Fe-S cluster assembly scaffold protein SufB
MKKIEIKELEIIFFKMIEKLKSEGFDELTFDDDFYRIIPTEKWDSYEEDIIHEASLFDDLDLVKLLKNDSNRILTYVDFDRVASILRAISQKNNPIL